MYRNRSQGLVLDLELKSEIREIKQSHSHSNEKYPA